MSRLILQIFSLLCVLFISSRAFPTRQVTQIVDNGEGLYLIRFRPTPESIPYSNDYLSRSYLFDFLQPIQEDDELSLNSLNKRNIAIGRGDGFRPGK
ncbi:hypothetical protein FO519_007089 [Halicephalobus sp. NKZ332]|nr:hypothetical protein FO519_007089 [Halicephalobus sp. NKZ332]